MAKLYQHQTDETYYTKLLLRDNQRAGIVTRQVHPDGVAYLKHCGVRVDQEIPRDCVFQLWEYEWLFTKDETPHWGEVDWAPRWTTIQPRPLHELRPFRRAASPNNRTSNNGHTDRPSAADQLVVELQAVREKAARERDERWERLIADIEAKQKATREEQARRRAAREREAAAKKAEERRQREVEQVEAKRTQYAQSLKRRQAAAKGAETRRHNAERKRAEATTQLQVRTAGDGVKASLTSTSAFVAPVSMTSKSTQTEANHAEQMSEKREEQLSALAIVVISIIAIYLARELEVGWLGLFFIVPILWASGRLARTWWG